MISDKEIAELEGHISDNNYEPLSDNYSNIIPALITRLRECEAALRIYEIAPDLKFRISCPGCEPDCDLKHYGRHNPARAYFKKVEGEK